MFTFSFDSGLRTRRVARGVRRRAGFLAAVILTTGLGVPAPAQVITYEGKVFPEQVGWMRFNVGIERRLEEGWFIQTLPDQKQDFYRFNIGGISGLVGHFFVEWRAVTDNPESLIYDLQVPAVVSAAGHAASLYHTVMTKSAAVLLRDVVIPRVIVPVSIGVPHDYRVEVFPDEYIWYIDGVVTDSGVPEGPYPDADAFVIWGVEGNDGVTATTSWDFVRVGRIPDDASGDYDSDEAMTLIDQYFLVDCLTKDGPGIFGGPGNDAGPGCRFADFDGDADVDLLDLAAFQNVFGR